MDIRTYNLIGFILITCWALAKSLSFLKEFISLVSLTTMSRNSMASKSPDAALAVAEGNWVVVPRVMMEEWKGSGYGGRGEAE